MNRRRILIVLVTGALVVGGGGLLLRDDGADAPTAAPTTTAATTASSASSTTVPTTTTTQTPLPEFPEARRNLEHGGATWAVVLAGSTEFEDPALVGAVEAAEAAGYTTGPTDCDLGAPEALGFRSESGVYTVSVYFASRADAEQARSAFLARSVDGVVAEVETYCMD